MAHTRVPLGYMLVPDAIVALAAIRLAGAEPSAAVQRAGKYGYRGRVSPEELEESDRNFWRQVDAGAIGLKVVHGSSGGMLDAKAARVKKEIPFIRRFRGGTLRFLRPKDLVWRAQKPTSAQRG